MNRIRAAFHTNEPQSTSVALMTLLNLAACAGREHAPLWLWLFAGLFWIAVAFGFNLISPIPTYSR